MEERKMILKMIDEGKISAEDGEKLMKAIGNQEKKQSTVSSSTTRETSELSTQVNWDEGNKRFDERENERQNGSDESSRWSEGARWFSDFVESAVTKIKELDLDFNFGNAVEVNHIFQHTNMTEELFEVSLENGTIDVVVWDEEDVKVDCKAKVYKADGEEEARDAFLENTVLESVGGELHLYTKSKRLKVNATIYVPKKKLDKLKLYTFNGKISLRDVDSTYVTVKSVNGSLELEDLKADVLEAEAMNGTIHIKGGQSERIDLRTANGTIDIEGSFDDIDAESLNGTINCRLRDVKEGRASLNATTGSIYVVVPDEIGTKAKLKTNVGNYHWKLPNVDVLEEKRDFIQKTLSLVSNPSYEQQLRIEASTKTGSVSLKSEGRE
ncbi:DUF4097 domain-containing protein [Geomicrobium sp. JCM 19039]|uniref:DUF4097 family beta strand repeat-containing protein n=1 Tax=Geomicrobium sp. JCM 19039 TaxID=1460636 RepID=UPI00045F46B9|nr:DUF4097 domain-containing protein [Geomicrobium sp. JCM 19039]GAK11664.1 hypothetical protein JCM19039_1374 [Geomicrobium sp. JCM 19039]